MRRTSLLVVSAALLCAAASHASTMEVRYRLEGAFGVVSNPGGFTPIAPALGFLRLTYPTSATGPLSSMGAGFAPLPGPVALLGGRFAAETTQLASHLPGSMALAVQHLSLHFEVATALGTLRPTGTLLFPHLEGEGSGMRTCFGVAPHCNPVTAGIPQPIVVAPFTFSWNATNHLVGTALRATALVPKFIAFGAPIGFQLVTATEIDRHLVPEPGSLPLVAGGLAALAWLAARRRARR